MISAVLSGLEQRRYQDRSRWQRGFDQCDKQEEKRETSAGAVYSERYSGSLYRSFSLPQEVDDAKTEAKYQDGVLSLA